MKIFLDANVCLDLLDTKRPTSEASVAWYMEHKDDEGLSFYFSGDFITTLYYHLTQKQKRNAALVVKAINALCEEVTPVYLAHSDFKLAQRSFFDEALLDDFEDFMVLHSALRNGCNILITRDKKMLQLQNFYDIVIKLPA